MGWCSLNHCRRWQGILQQFLGNVFLVPSHLICVLVRYLMDFEECYCWNNCMRVLWWMCILCDWSSAGFLPQDAENKAMLICNLECSSLSEKKKRPFRGSSFFPRSLSLSAPGGRVFAVDSLQPNLNDGLSSLARRTPIAKSHFFGTGSRPSCMFLTLHLLFINTPLHIHVHKKDTHMWASDM